MATLGDIVYSFRDFWTMQRTLKAVPRRRIDNPVTSDAPGMLSGWSRWSDERKQRMALATGWVYSDILRIAQAATASDLMVKRRVEEDEEDIKNHPFEVVFDTPNPDLSREYVMMFTVFSVYIDRGYWFLYPDQRGDIAEIWPMPFNRVEMVAGNTPDARRYFPDADPTRLVAGYLYYPHAGKKPHALPPDCVVMFRFPDPLDPYGALPPIRAGYSAVKQDTAQTAWNTDHFDKRAGIPSSLIGVSPDLSDLQFKEVKQALKEHHGQSMVVRAGTLSVDFVQQSHEAMQFLEGREFNKKEIDTILGVPENVADQDGWRWFISNTVWPLLRMMAGQITTQVIRPYFGDNIFAEFEDIRPQDRSIAVQESVQYAPFRAMNEERATRNEDALKPIKLPDDVPLFGGLSLYDDIPTQLIPTILDMLPKPKQEVPPQLLAAQGQPPGFAGPPSMPGSAGAAHEQGQAEVENNPDGQQAEAETNTEQPKAEKAASIALKAAFREWEDLATKRAKRNTPAVVYFNDLIPNADSYTLATVLGMCREREEVAAVFEHAAEYTNIKAILGNRGDVDPRRLELEDVFTAAMVAYLEAQTTRVVQAVQAGGNALPEADFWRNETALITAFLTPYLEQWSSGGIGAAVDLLSTLSLGVDASVNARAAEWAGAHAAELAKGLTDTTRELVKAKTKNWIQSGQPLEILSRDLGRIIAPQWRAEMIASTEVTRAFAQASKEIAGELDVIKTVYWQSARDERVCPVCGPLHGQAANKNGVFPGGFTMPPAHPRCRCWLSYGI